MSLKSEIKKFCYRVTHIRNLRLILMERKLRSNYSIENQEFHSIGNPDIIRIRKIRSVKIPGYGSIGDYVPFYFTPRSIMLYNIITGIYDPVVPKRDATELIILRCSIAQLVNLSRWFFTDGQANNFLTNHYNDLRHLDKIDWACIQNGDFTKSPEDYDRPRRYQAEFLVFREVPLEYVESINVLSEETASNVQRELSQINCNLAVNIRPDYFFLG